MSRLPISPDLEHLKQQAKQLLRAWRSGDSQALRRLQTHLPGLSKTAQQARLSDAQFVIAREYGFPSWPKLKTHVEAQQAERLVQQDQTARRSERQKFIQALAADLTGWAQQHEVAALGRRFAKLPLRDILAVREQLASVRTITAVVDGLLEGLAQPQPRVRFDCAAALDHLADERCTAALTKLLSDPVPRVRRAALHSLGCDACKPTPLKRGGDLATLLSEMALHDSSVRVRRAAVPLLENYWPDARVQDLLKLLSIQEDETIRREARQILRRRGSQPEQR